MEAKLCDESIEDQIARLTRLRNATLSHVPQWGVVVAAFADAVYRYVAVGEHAQALVNLSSTAHSERHIAWISALVHAVFDFDQFLLVPPPNRAIPYSYVASQATELIDALVDACEDARVAGRSDAYALLFLLLVQSLRPYLGMLGAWLQRGTTADAHAEFLVFCARRTPPLLDAFWREGCQVRPLDLDQAAGGVPAAPLFLEDLAHRIMRAGQAALLLHAVETVSAGMLGTTASALLRPAAQTTPYTAADEWLYTVFCDNVAEMHADERLRAPSSRPAFPSVAIEECARGWDESEVNRRLAQQEAPVHVFDDARINADRVERTKIVRALIRDIQDDQYDPAATPPLVLPMAEMLDRALCAPIRQRMDEVSQQLLAAINDPETGVIAKLTSVIETFLMKDGFVWSQFAQELFQCVSERRPWQTSVELPNGITVVHDRDLAAGVAADDMDTYGNVTLDVPLEWPLDLVLSPGHIRVLNQVFGLLLCVWRAKAALAELFKVLPRRQADANGLDGNMVHRLHLLRARQAHFCERVHAHVVETIFLPGWRRCQETLRDGKDLDAMRDDVEELMGTLELKGRKQWMTTMEDMVRFETRARMLKMSRGVFAAMQEDFQGSVDAFEDRIDDERKKLN